MQLLHSFKTRLEHIGRAGAESRWRPGLKTPQARQAVDFLLGPKWTSAWSIHSVGIDSGESSLPVLSAGAVIAFEPIFSVGDDAFYLEDMILVTERGHEVLSSGLPYTANEIERAMRAPSSERCARTGNDATILNG
ncbi:MAG: hypothetical protein M3373_04880 [Gemmatimonadota bacterium]|nr:hypothetical protein [Gemmatimonadota bacterium]